MSIRGDRIARAIKSFVENPITNLEGARPLADRPRRRLSQLPGRHHARACPRGTRPDHHRRFQHPRRPTTPHRQHGSGRTLPRTSREEKRREKGLARTMSQQPYEDVDPQTLRRRGLSDHRHPTRSLLATTAAIEAGTGVALVISPSSAVLALLGSPLDPTAGSVIGRFLGAALLSLGTACWIARDDALGRSGRCLVAVMLVYNVAAVALLGQAFIGLGIAGVLLWPAILLHALLAVWCVVGLRSARRTSASESTRGDPCQEAAPSAS